MKISWTDKTDSTIYKDALAIRYQVFVNEQKVPVTLEVDELETSSLHLVLYEKDQPIATARIYKLNEDTYKVQRVAVLPEHRKHGVGTKLMKAVEEKAKLNQTKQLTLGSQNSAIPFYKKLGYTISSEEFMDAGIPHHSMEKILS